MGSLYANVGRNADRMRRNLFPSGLEREQRRKIRVRRSDRAEQALFLLRGLGGEAKCGKNSTLPLPVPTEAEEQIALFEWAALQSGRFPELALLYHVPNGGSRNKIEAARLRAQGVKSGVPDLCLPVARGGNHGLYIELKRQRGGRIGEEQVRWINGLLKQGYAAAICKGWQEAADVIIDYLRRETEG